MHAWEGTVNLSLQNPPSGLGVTYQWQSASDAGFTSNLTNLGTSATYTATVNQALYYRCNVTCNNSTGTSTPVLVGLNNFIIVIVLRYLPQWTITVLQM